MAPTPKRVHDALAAVLGSRLSTVEGWDNPAIAARNVSSFAPIGVLMHHTAGTDSLNWLAFTNPYAPVRAAHLLVRRDGTVKLIYSLACYHAGLGGPLPLPGVKVPANQGNSHFFGIEIESLGTKPGVGSDPAQITPAQVVSASIAAAALVTLLGRDERSVVNHRTWAPARKVDTQLPDRFWQGAVADWLRQPAPSRPVVTLAHLVDGKRSDSARIVNEALASSGYDVGRSNLWSKTPLRALRREQLKRRRLSWKTTVRDLGFTFGFDVR